MEKINNNFTKIISLVLAVILWIYVIYTEDPISEIWIRGVPITLQNVEVLNEQSLTILDMSKENIDVQLRGRRLTLAKLDTKDITATVDFQNVKNKGEVNLPIMVKSNVLNVEILKKSQSNLTFEIENIVTRELPIEVLTKGEVLEGYVVGPIECEPKSVAIEVGESLSSFIRAVTDEVNLQDASGDINTVKDIKILNGDGEIVPVINKNHENTSIKINMHYQKQIRVVPDLINQDKNKNYIINFEEVVPKTAIIEGPIDQVKDIEELKLETVDLSNIFTEDDIITTLNLPEGIKCISPNRFNIKINLQSKE